MDSDTEWMLRETRTQVRSYWEIGESKRIFSQTIDTPNKHRWFQPRRSPTSIGEEKHRQGGEVRKTSGGGCKFHVSRFLEDVAQFSQVALSLFS